MGEEIGENGGRLPSPVFHSLSTMDTEQARPLLCPLESIGRVILLHVIGLKHLPVHGDVHPCR